MMELEKECGTMINFEVKGLDEAKLWSILHETG